MVQHLGSFSNFSLLKLKESFSDIFCELGRNKIIIIIWFNKRTQEKKMDMASVGLLLILYWVTSLLLLLVPTWRQGAGPRLSGWLIRLDFLLVPLVFFLFFFNTKLFLSLKKSILLAIVSHHDAAMLLFVFNYRQRDKKNTASGKLNVANR